MAELVQGQNNDKGCLAYNTINHIKIVIKRLVVPYLLGSGYSSDKGNYFPRSLN